MSTCENFIFFREKSQCRKRLKTARLKSVKKSQKSLFDDNHKYRSSYLVQSSFHDRSLDRSMTIVTNQLIINDEYCVLEHTALCFLQLIGFLVFFLILRKNFDSSDGADDSKIKKNENSQLLRKRRIVSMGHLTNTNLLTDEQQKIGFELDVYC